MNIKFVVATTKADRFDTILGKSLEKNVTNLLYNFGNGHSIYWVYKNNESLAAVYNRSIKHIQYFNEVYTHIVFLHDDLYVNCKDFIERVEDSLNRFDIIGLAGTSELDLRFSDKPVLWHLCSGRESHLGCVAHGTSENYMYTSFGPLNKRALLIDGLFIGMDVKKCKDLTFDTKNPANFHFYDLIFSMDAALLKLKTGVVDIPVIHQSPGLKEFTPEWLAGEKYFKEKYNKFLGNVVKI